MAIAVGAIALLGVGIWAMGSGDPSDGQPAQVELKAEASGVLVRIVNAEYLSTSTILHLELHHPFLENHRLGSLFTINTSTDVSFEGFESGTRIQSVGHGATDGIDRREIRIGGVKDLDQKVTFEIKRLCVVREWAIPACEFRDGPWSFTWVPSSGPAPPTPCGRPLGAMGQPAFLSPSYLPPGYVKTDEDFKCDRSGGITGMTTSHQANPGSGAILLILQDLRSGHDLDAEMKTLPSTPIAFGAGRAYKLTNNAGNKHSVVWSAGDIVATVTATDISFEEVLRVAESMR